ncbi:unnamed protein product [Somion occarium]|uniref:F-box domain-containing protein n=1 Tax=Somion occarium TaxID=3059160 RepID=A0ABP1CWI7_9APHY
MITSTGNIQSPITLLPQELLDRSIDFLHNDKPSLFNCMLVSRRWVDASQYHLYDTKKILLVKDSNAKRVAAFKEYLEDTPHVRHLIRTFSIIRATGRRRCLVELIELLSILKNLPRLESFFLDGIELTTVNHFAYVAMATPLFGIFRLRILALNDVAGRESRATIHGAFMIDFLGLFSEIQTLKLVSSYSQSVWTEMADCPSLTHLQKKTRVSHLQTWLMCRFAVGPMVLPKAINVNSIKYYSLKVLYPQQLQNLGAFLRNPSLNITYLDIDIKDYINWGSHMGLIISHCYRLSDISDNQFYITPSNL